MPAQNKLSVLFVCTANQFRSPIAEAEFIKLIQDHGMYDNWIVGSAGSWASNGLPAYPSVSWMQEYTGLDLSLHRSRPISAELIAQFSLILVMEKGQKEALKAEFPEIEKKLFMLTELTSGPVYDIPDPIRLPEEDSIKVAHEIMDLVKKCYQEICLRTATLRENSEDL